MKVGDIIQDYQFTCDKGIILIVEEGQCYVLALGEAYASWLPEEYIKKCKVIA
jgi:hypothetical protein